MIFHKICSLPPEKVSLSDEKFKFHGFLMPLLCACSLSKEQPENKLLVSGIHQIRIIYVNC